MKCLSITEKVFDTIPVHERVLPAFDDDETKAILESIDTSTKQGRRDYAVVMLALDTGLRWSDIAKMQLSDILWEKREIRVKQEKTDTPLTLPLTLRAGTAVADYILEARPKCSSPEPLGSHMHAGYQLTDPG